MKVLNRDELQIAEGVLLKHLPKSYKVYGFLFGINRNKPTTLEVVVDTWPDFKVIICRPDPEKKRALNFMKKGDYSMDEQSLRKMLTDENAVDWSTYFMIGGLDVSHAPMLKQVSSDRRVKYKTDILVHLLYLQDTNYLHMPAINSELELRISSLNLSYVDLVNKTWKFGRDEKGYRKIENQIINFPSCCITDGRGQPVSWILVCDYCAVGMLYTLPEHRAKGYANVVISTSSYVISR
ncbi:glycine N-acyltransferase-like protein 3 [Oreochromis niloticus]|uniref:glycine N-acyltransferase-like protein 3 n=1 Tax=Oreochromis niloticus TaxID=8128 RepID=UPI00090595F6|nr:glycine N-acyltransferase-like protein 3 [Oreochromis niloticus]